MAIQNFLPLNTLDKGEFVFCRFDGVGDSVSYPIVQMPIITQANWQKRVITSIICLANNKNDDPEFTALLQEVTTLFRGYYIINYAELKYYTITLKTDKNTTIIDNLPLNLISTPNIANEFLVRQKKTVLNVSLDNSFITRHSDASGLSTSVVIPFYIQYK